MWMGDHGGRLEPCLVPSDMPLCDLWVMCLDKNPERRPSIDDVVDSLRRREMRKANIPSPTGVQVTAKNNSRRRRSGCQIKKGFLKSLPFFMKSVRS